jgi:protein-disulfide isomerase
VIHDGMLRHATLAAAVALAACGAPQKRQDELEKRLATVEAEVTRLRADAAARDQIAVENGVTTTALAAKVTELDTRLQQAERRPPPRPSRPQPDPAKVYAVPVAGSPVEGVKTAKVTIVFSGEYACPFCHKVTTTLAALRAKYGKDLRLVHKSLIVHPAVATAPALAACAAHKQNRWREMDTALWKDAFEARSYDDDTMRTIARSIKLDMKRFEADFTGQACKDEIGADQALLTRLGVTGTPAFFINGRFLSGNQPQAAFEAIIDEEMKKASEAIKKGVKPSEYYDSIVASGLTQLEPAKP